MKKRLIILATLVLMVLMISGIYVTKVNATTQGDLFNSDYPDYLSLDFETIQKNVGMKVVDISQSYKPQTTLSDIKQISSEFPEFQVTKNVHYQLNKVTLPGYNLFSYQALEKNPKLKLGNTQELPVWLVTFRGVNIPSSNLGKKIYNHEIVYVVDAETGEMLWGFTYR